MNKPKVSIVGLNGNIFNVITVCKKALTKDGQFEKATEMVKRVNSEATSYSEALSIISEYVDFGGDSNEV